jgi:hypothetical protein
MDSEKRISRREMIRNIGIAGAVAWAAPVLTSLPAEAAAAKNICKKYPPGCQAFQGCSNSNPNCACFHQINNGKVKKKGQCFDLSAGGYCSDYPMCTSNSDCSGGSKCMTSCCDSFGLGPVCVPLCAKGKAGAPRKPLKRDGRATIYR